MKYLANIITDSKIEVSSFFNISTDFETVDKNIPTLIIGWRKTQSIFPNQNILDKKINENTFWTFSKREKRYQYEIDLENFIENITKELTVKVNYKFFNYILSSKETQNNFKKYIEENKNYIYYNSRFIYIYNEKHNITLGISIVDLNYIGINIKNFISSLNKNNNNIITDNLSFLDSFSLKFIKDNIKSVPFLVYLRNS